MATFDENGNYVKTTWKGGDKITAAKLNKIEESLEAINNNDISRHVEADARLDKLESGTASDKQAINAKVDALEDVVEANKDAADLEIYSINQHMTLLDKKIDDGVAEVEAIANAVDGKIAAAETNMNDKISQAKVNMQNQVNQGKVDMEAMVAEVEADLEGLHAKDEELSEQLAYIAINVKQYGVKGDGVTDETARLQDIFDLHPKTVFFPEGIYYFSNVKLFSNCEIYGTKNTTLIVKDIELFKCDSGENILIRDFNIECINSTLSNQRIMFFNYCNDISLKNINIKNTKKHGILIIDTDNVLIDNVNCENIQGSAFLISPQTKDCYDINVKNCNLYNVAQDTSSYGVYYNSGDDYAIRSGLIDNVKVDTTNHGGIFPGGDNITVSNCIVKNCQEWRGIWIHDASNIKIIGGTYSNCGREGVYVQKAHNVDIIGVTCENNRNSGIKIDSDYTQAGRLQGDNTNKDVRVISCNCSNNSQGDNSGRYSGINISSIDDNGMKNVQIIGCRVLDNQNTKTHKRSIESNGKGQGHIIIGNYCDGSIQEGILVEDAQIFEGNYPVTFNQPSIGGSAWNGSHIKMGNYEIWIDHTVAKPRIKNGEPTSETDGTYLSTPPVGSSSNRPTNVTPGTHYFDSTLNKPIWRNSANTNWIDSDGNVV